MRAEYLAARSLAVVSARYTFHRIVSDASLPDENCLVRPGGIHLQSTDISLAEALLFLKSLDLAGFKSFDRPTRLEFPEGISALVGPNGSGKSNIVDAIRWCLGEQSARDLRGQRADDLIHAGKRRVMGSAEVTLTLESGPGDAVEWAERSVSRRVYRSGESEYLVNRARQRLRDVSAALHEVGIDNPRFVVVNQGMADFLLSATPGERRGLLEQAAGLSGYRQRREEAATKLGSTEQNIGTIEVVLAELEPRLRSLRRQARAVEEREELAARLQRRLQQWYARRWGDLVAQLAALDAEVSAAAVERRQQSDALVRLEERAETSHARERAWRASVDSATSALHVTERERDAARHDLDRVIHQLSALEALRREREQRAASVVEEIRVAADRHAEAERALEALDAEIAAREADASGVPALLQEHRSRLTEVQERNRTTDRERARVAGEASRLRERRRGYALELTHLSARQGSLGDWLTKTDGDLERLQEELRASSEALERTRGEEADAEARLASAERDVAGAQERLSRLQRTGGRVRNRLSLLGRSLRDAEQLAARLQATLVGTVLDGLIVEEGWHRAVAAALGDWAFVRSSDVATLSARDTHSFLEWREGLAGHDARWADELVSSPGQAPPLLLGTVVVPDPAHAREIWDRIAGLPALRVGSPWLQVVTRDGVAISPAGTRTHLLDDRGAAYLRVRSEVERLGRLVSAWTARQGRLRAAEEKARREVEDASTNLAALQKTAHAIRQSRAQHGAEIQRLERARTHLTSERDQRRKEQAALNTDLQRVEGEDAAAATRLIELTTSLSDLERRRGDTARELETCRARVAEIERRIADARRSVDVLKARRVSEQQLVSLLHRDARRLEAEAETLRAQQQTGREEVERVQATKQMAEARLADLHTVHVEQARALAETRGRRPLEEDLREELRTARARAAEAVGVHERATARQGELQAERSRLSAEIARELQTHPQALPPVEGENPPSEDELRRLRGRVMQYAELDSSVIAEYRELAQRQEYLSSQVADLRAAAEGLREIMAVSDREMRTRFQGALASVNREFEHIFRVMLRGGEACLEQIDDDGGIEVRATLPGKRARSSSAFSGGERALVASSLLFAVLRIRPTPFCVLDEVDAALDETNVDRYLAALREISSRTQVIVVTHNRATMAAANALYGLTLDAEGASTVLSLRLDAYQEAV